MIKRRFFTSIPGYTDDFYRVFDFLVKTDNRFGMTWVRWEWAFAKGIQGNKLYNQVGIWEDNGEIVALAIYEHEPDTNWIVVDQYHSYLLGEIVQFCKDNLAFNNFANIFVNENDSELQKCVEKSGFTPTNHQEQMLVRQITPENTKYELPATYSITDFSEVFDMKKYNNIMWWGFNHTGEIDNSEKELEWRKNCATSPHSNPKLQLSVVNEAGDFVSHCAVWHYPNKNYVIVEPLATHPAFRGIGLGKAIIFEALRRSHHLGAKYAYVGSDQSFYKNIGFTAYTTDTLWGFQKISGYGIS